MKICKNYPQCSHHVGVGRGAHECGLALTHWKCVHRSWTATHFHPNPEGRRAMELSASK